MKADFNLAWKESTYNESIDDDGILRDINFDEQLNWKNIIVAVNHFSLIWNKYEIFDSEGAQLKPIQINDIKPNHSITSCWSGNNVIKKIQLFICRNCPNYGFVEITFDPKDVDLNYSSTDLKNLLLDFKKTVSSKTLFLRYENISWQHGNHDSTDVILYINSNE